MKQREIKNLTDQVFSNRREIERLNIKMKGLLEENKWLKNSRYDLLDEIDDLK